MRGINATVGETSNSSVVDQLHEELIAYGEDHLRNGMNMEEVCDHLLTVGTPGCPDPDFATVEKVIATLAAKAADVGRINDSRLVDAADWLIQEPAPADQLLADIVDVGDKLAVLGSPKRGKTYFLLQLALSLAAGKDFLRWSVPRPRRVLVVQMEVRDRHYHERLTHLAAAMAIDQRMLAARLHIANCRCADDVWPSLRHWARQLRPEAIVLDPLYKLLDGDENQNKDVKGLFRSFDELMGETGATIIYSHHDPKGTPGDRDICDRGAGSNVISRDYDAAFALTAHRSDEDAIVVSSLLRNYAPQRPVVIKWGESKLQLVDLPAVVETTRTRNRRNATTCTNEEAIAQSDCAMMEYRRRLTEDLGLPERRARALIQKLISEESLVQERRPGTRLTWVASPEIIGQRIEEWNKR